MADLLLSTASSACCDHSLIRDAGICSWFVIVDVAVGVLRFCCCDAAKSIVVLPSVDAVFPLHAARCKHCHSDTAPGAPPPHTTHHLPQRSSRRVCGSLYRCSSLLFPNSVDNREPSVQCVRQCTTDDTDPSGAPYAAQYDHPIERQPTSPVSTQPHT
jgi:hypothetical protein